MAPDGVDGPLVRSKMGTVGTIGYLLIGVGPAAVIFATRIASRPFLVVLTITSCASWILAAMVLALPLAFFLPLGTEGQYVTPFVVYVLLHEFSRRVMWSTQRGWMAGALDGIAQHFGYRKVSAGDRMNMHLAWGLGQGVARGIFFFLTNTLSVSFGPGTWYTETCPSVPYFLTSALVSVAFVSIHTSAMLVDFLGELESRDKSVLESVASFGPALAALLTLGNLATDGCLLVLPVLSVFALIQVWHTVNQLRQ